MKLLGLMWSNLFRKPTRTTLTLLSVMIAFLLFTLLQSIAGAFEGGVEVAGADRLMTSAKYSQIESLPYNQRQQILAVDGVEAITHTSWFGGVYQDPKNFFATFPVDPLSYFDIYSELTLEPEGALERFAAQRTAAVVDIGIAEKYGWQVGDTIPIIGSIYPRKDGERLWEFELVGTFSRDGESSSFPLFLFNYDYFAEATVFGEGLVDNWTIRIADPERADEVARTIDGLFENSTDPTRTATEDEANRQFARQLGDIGFIITMIMSAVFFTILLLTGNTMTQGLRERIPELAVLKTLGFTDQTVSWLVLGEAVLLCLFGGFLGVGAALLLAPGLSASLEGFLGTFEISLQTIGYAFALAIAIGLAIGAMPALSARKLTIVDALRRQ